jgi:hypothetical protein
MVWRFNLLFCFIKLHTKWYSSLLQNLPLVLQTPLYYQLSPRLLGGSKLRTVCIGCRDSRTSKLGWFTEIWHLWQIVWPSIFIISLNELLLQGGYAVIDQTYCSRSDAKWSKDKLAQPTTTNMYARTLQYMKT